MSQERANPAQWDVFTAELRSYREQQKQTWGDLDNALIGRYLAGEVTDEERRTVETACKNHPELRKLTDLVLDVLNELPASSSEPPAAPPRLLSFTDHRRARRPFLSRVRERAALVSAACLLLALGVALLRVPGPAPVRYVARLRGPEVAQVVPPTGAPLDDTFPAPPVAAASIRAVSAVDRVPQQRVEEIARVADWVEPRLRRDVRSSMVKTSAPAGLSGGMKTAAPARGHFFASKDNRATPADLKRATPYLALGLCQDARPILRDRCGRALLRLAPYAGEAVPLLKQALQQPCSAKQRKIIVEVLKNLGPAANDAAPVLATLAERGPADLRAEAREALCCVSVGVHDQAHVLSPAACRRLNAHAARLSQRRLYFTTQTYRRKPSRRTQTYSFQNLPANCCGVCVAICAESQAVEVTLTPDLAGKDPRLNARSLQKLIQKHLRDRTPEKGLEEAVTLLEQTMARR